MNDFVTIRARNRSSKRSLSAVVLALAISGVLLADVVMAEAEPDLRRSVNEAVRGALKVAPATGVHVVEADAGRDVYSWEADVPRILASNTKLFTSAAALDLLGPGYFLETRILARGRIEGRVLYGDLAVIGGGDPLLSGREHGGDPYGVFRRWARQLSERGVRRVQGDLYLVHGLFDDQRVHPEWPEDQLDRWYEAPVDALSFSDNCVLVRVRGGRGKAPTLVELEPKLDLFAIDAEVTRGRRADVSRPSADDPWTLMVRGGLRPGEEHAEWVTVPDPVTWFGAALRAAFLEEGFAIVGSTRPVVQLDSAGEEGAWEELLVHRSDLLAVLEIVNKRSQNLFAESVVKLLGAKYCRGGSWGEGVRAVHEGLDHILSASELSWTVRVDPATLRLTDGSGMSRSNTASPRAVTTLLVAMARHRWAAEFLATLPYSGEPGLRWENRLADPPYRGNVLAKTGTLRAVSTLSGFAKARSGKLYVFSILNNGAASDWKARAAQDAILRAVIDHG